MSHVNWLIYGVVAISLGLWQKKTMIDLFLGKINFKALDLGDARRVLKDYYAKVTFFKLNSEDSRICTNSLLSDMIPPDVLIDIVSRLPAKSVAKCRCVSKLWALILGRPELDELFLTKSLTHPQILLALKVDRKIAFSTLPQLQNPNHDNSSSSLVATPPHHTDLPACGICRISRPVCGLVCVHEYFRKTFVICNPITGKSLTLPKPETKMMWSRIFFGYDSTDKQFKILCSTWSHDNNNQKLNALAEHYVLTLGTEQKGWRMIQCRKPLTPMIMCGDGICINGVLYYLGKLNPHEGDIVVVCFDIRFEKLSFISQPEDLWRLAFESRLINYKGQLCIIQPSEFWRIDGSTTCFGLWVLKDTKKHEWTKHIYVLPPMWRNIVAKTELFIVGMTNTCEILLSPHILLGHFYLFYYNLEMNIVRRVRIRGFEAFKPSIIVANCLLDYVENMKLI